MCRIAGIISQKLTEAQIISGVSEMCKAMHKGGPDGEGLCALPAHQLAFGHRRLALIDLSEQGKQPMPYQNGLWITYNGEIYNYLALKADLLSKGFHFNNATDTEVILAGYQAYGTAFFSQLNGMFAFALFDPEKNETYLVRDEQGIKPLYYQLDNEQLVFASEVKAFKALNPNAQTNPDWKIYFLAFGFIPEPFTTLANVYSLPKGCFLTYNHQQQTANTQSFLTPQSIEIPANQEAANQHTNAVLNQAVQQHLIADAPIGVFLSGGIDSSLLAIIASEKSNQQINTISINFNEPKFSEKAYQDIIVNQINSKHITYTVTPNDFEQHIAQIFEDMDQPSNDGINSWFVNKVAKENGLKAVLSGIGADELFGGYPSFLRIKLIDKFKSLPKWLLKFACKSSDDKIQRIAYLSYDNPIGEYLFLRGFFTPKAISKLLKIDEKIIAEKLNSYPLPKEINLLKGKDRISWFETNIYMQNQLLKDTDYMSMAHGVEVRVPFLDKNVVNLATQMPNHLRFSERPKSLLIQAYKNLLPERIWNRPKRGFTFPFQEWFKQYEPIQDAAHYQQNPLALQLVQQFKDNKLHWSKLFAVYQVFKND